MAYPARKGMTAAQREEQRKKIWNLLHNPLATKKEKRIMASKWRFNQLSEEYRKANIKKYQREWAKMEAAPESEFENLTKF